MGKHSKPRKLKAAPITAAVLIPVSALTAAAMSESGDHAVGAQQRVQHLEQAALVSAALQKSGSSQKPSAATRSPAAKTVSSTSVSVPAATATKAAKAIATTEPPPAPKPAPPPLPASVTDGQVPGNAYAAYQRAADRLTREMPQCGITWNIIAGIGRVESQHGFGAKTDANGRLLTPVYGPRLDGSLAGNEVVTDTDGGALDGDPVYDRAVGPMQFLPETWKKYAEDGSGDGIADPQNIYDAALTTGRYLCDGNLNLHDVTQQVTAILRYNNSMDYVNDVLGFARSY